MGEYSMEAYYNGLNEMNRNYEEYGCIAPGDSKVDNTVWKLPSGKVKPIKDMTDYELIGALHWINNRFGNSRNALEQKKHAMEKEIFSRGLMGKVLQEDNYWTTPDGKVRGISEMSEYQLVYAIRFIENGPHANGKWAVRLINMVSELEMRGISREDYVELEKEFWCDRLGKFWKFSDMSTEMLKQVLKYLRYGKQRQSHRIEVVEGLLKERGVSVC